MKKKQFLKSDESRAGRLSCALAAALAGTAMGGGGVLPWLDVTVATPAPSAAQAQAVVVDARWQAFAVGGPMDMPTTPRGGVLIIR